MKTKNKIIFAWAITDWGGGIKNPSVSIFDTQKDAQKALNSFNKMPDPSVKGERNKIVRVEIKILSARRGGTCANADTKQYNNMYYIKLFLNRYLGFRFILSHYPQFFGGDKECAKLIKERKFDEYNRYVEKINNSKNTKVITIN